MIIMWVLLCGIIMWHYYVVLLCGIIMWYYYDYIIKLFVDEAHECLVQYGLTK